MIKAGVTMLWISEAAEVAELDYGNLRRQYGPLLGLIGGIPLSILRSGSAEVIKDRLEETMIALLRPGRYIPLASGRVRNPLHLMVLDEFMALSDEELVIVAEAGQHDVLTPRRSI